LDGRIVGVIVGSVEFVAVDDGLLLGEPLSLSLPFASDGRLVKRGYVAMLSVHATRRRLGIGRRLIASLLATFGQLAVHQVGAA
jgi:ribosomal protein S18 acetylase RimI-like enzyme